MVVIVKASQETANLAASLRLYPAEAGIKSEADLARAEDGSGPAQDRTGQDSSSSLALSDDKTIICRCERVSLGEIRRAIRSGMRDLNQLKAVTRAGMGACGSKTCSTLLMGVFRSEGVDPKEVTGFTRRPLFAETPLGAFSNIKCQTEADEKASWSDF